MTFFVCLFLFAHLQQGQQIIHAPLAALPNAHSKKASVLSIHSLVTCIGLVDPFVGDLTPT